MSLFFTAFSNRDQFLKENFPCKNCEKKDVCPPALAANNAELNDSRKIICFRKSKGSVGRISVCNVTEHSAEHGIHCLPCSYTNDVINMLPY